MSAPEIAMSKFYETTITITVLSEDAPVSNVELDCIVAECNTGAFVLGDRNDSVRELDTTAAAAALIAAGSEPGFFGLDDPS